MPKQHFGIGCSPVNLLHIFRTPFLKNTSGRLLLYKEAHDKSRFCESQILRHLNIIGLRNLKI